MVLLISHASACPAMMESIVKMILTNVYRIRVTTVATAPIYWLPIHVTALKITLGHNVTFCVRSHVRICRAEMVQHASMVTVSARNLWPPSIYP